RHTTLSRDWSSDVCSSDLPLAPFGLTVGNRVCESKAAERKSFFSWACGLICLSGGLEHFEHFFFGKGLDLVALVAFHGLCCEQGVQYGLFGGLDHGEEEGGDPIVSQDRKGQ